MNARPEPSTPAITNNKWFWANIFVTLLLLAGGVWFLLTQSSLQAIATTFRQVNSAYIFLSILTILITFYLKTLRWQMMYAKTAKQAPFAPLFWTFMLGLYVNAIVPVLRLGEIARTVALYNKTGISKTETLTTLVIEKLLELIVLGLMFLFLLSSTILPTVLQDSVPTVLISAVALLALVALIAVSIYTEWTEKQLIKLSHFLPEKLSQLVDKLVISGLRGLTALRDVKRTLAIIALSIILGLVQIFTSYFLFLAFNLPFGLVEAAIIHVAVSIALVPPSTPAKIGVFDGVVAFLLVQFGAQNEAVTIGYTLIFHLVLFLPQIILGFIASWKMNWQWRSAT